MNNILILLLFNIIIIYLSYKKENIIIYSFIFIFLMTLYLHLLYNKYMNVIEGNSFYGNNSVVYSLWNEFDKDNHKEEKFNLDKYYIFKKVNDMIKLFIRKEERSSL